jgi:hypothetical protein
MRLCGSANLRHTCGGFGQLMRDNAETFRRHFGVTLEPGSFNVVVCDPDDIHGILDNASAEDIVIPGKDLVGNTRGDGRAWSCEMTSRKIPNPLPCWIFRRVGSQVDRGLVEILAVDKLTARPHAIEHGDCIELRITSPTLLADHRSTRGLNYDQLVGAVKHISEAWSHVLRKTSYAREFMSNADLHAGLDHTYAAHVHNAIVDVLLVDLIRELGALALDRDPRSASIAAALHALDNPRTLAELQARSNTVAPVLIKDHDVDEASKARIQETVRQELRRDNLERLAEFQSNIPTLKKEVLESETAKHICLRVPISRLLFIVFPASQIQA